MEEQSDIAEGLLDNGGGKHETTALRQSRRLETSRKLAMLIIEYWTGVELAGRIPNERLKHLSHDLIAELSFRYVTAIYLSIYSGYKPIALSYSIKPAQSPCIPDCGILQMAQ